MIHFHWRAGARVALRVNGMVGAAVVFFFGIEDDALARLRHAILELVARAPGWDARLDLAGICVALAAVAMPRVTLGATGWMRSLAISGTSSRRAAVAALCLVQAFSIVVAVLAMLGAVLVYHVPLSGAKLAGIVLTIVAAAALVLPVERRAAVVFAVLALALAVPGRWGFDAASLVALAIGDGAAGSIVRLRRRQVRTGRDWRMGSSRIAEWVRLTLRTLQAPTVVVCVLTPAIFVLFGYFIVEHNPGLDAETAHRTVRICGTLALGTFASALASSIVRTRPVWAWARSLPWSSRDRIVGDALLHGVALGLVPIAMAPLDWRNAIVLAFIVPPLAAAAAGAIRIGAHRQTSAAGEIMLVAVACGTLIALWPWTSIIAACATPPIIALARRRDRETIATRWDELHHDAAGDPAWTIAS